MVLSLNEARRLTDAGVHADAGGAVRSRAAERSQVEPRLVETQSRGRSAENGVDADARLEPDADLRLLDAEAELRVRGLLPLDDAANRGEHRRVVHEVAGD